MQQVREALQWLDEMTAAYFEAKGISAPLVTEGRWAALLARQAVKPVQNHGESEVFSEGKEEEAEHGEQLDEGEVDPSGHSDEAGDDAEDEEGNSAEVSTTAEAEDENCEAETIPLCLGPRLLHAKALFGDVMRGCHKELLTYVKTIPSEKLAKVMLVACAQYNVCKPLIRMETLNASADCMLRPVRNNSHPLYTRLNFTEEYKVAVIKAVGCAWKILGSSPAYVDASEEAAAFAHQALLAFGWT
ncbi:hypothetical protein MTO96_031022 [Rhipicephalus appendiculatus]